MRFISSTALALLSTVILSVSVHARPVPDVHNSPSLLASRELASHHTATLHQKNSARDFSDLDLVLELIERADAVDLVERNHEDAMELVERSPGKISAIKMGLRNSMNKFKDRLLKKSAAKAAPMHTPTAPPPAPAPQPTPAPKPYHPDSGCLNGSPARC
ncbi:hypothetical protein DFP72DRAFT_924142 [Ephemerocybe angulata]|uniref:Uncharacterized protein n=1 Tax=Ephemerocybe angulata TaxID=980116 RepID=A0A8H6HF65_9AGAR|nr:hypothetical protein DFP72DRAFT_924142 [Tulosesus angulatus]